MDKIYDFSLEKHDGPYEKWPRRTRLYFRGQDTGTKIPGFIIEGQDKCHEGYLLITSQDCPYEESNDFILLGPSFKELAHKILLFPYESYLINSHWPVSADSIRLHYYEQLFFTLAIKKSASLFGNKPKLVLTRFKDFEKDPEACASLNNLQNRLKEIAEKRGKT